ncbi:MAG: DEAD/DEAH box helicase [Actinomycetota bacterium]|nr:DEAD/DEAH box helicase [Actinomycetota bacterium]
MGTRGHDFELDDYQRRAIAAIDEGRSVLVAAPTGSGKTVVAEHAIAEALRDGAKAFYTAPIKALSNQKYADLVRLHGAEQVGLLTGDNSVNGDAPVVVMTTEVLRNMIYAASPALRGLRYVVLDEVHYLQDAYRGPVWEEVIIHLDPSVRLVCLSATVSNAEELTEWIETVRGPTAAIVEQRRPVELRNLFMVADRSSDRLQLLPMLVDGRPNPEGLKLDATAQRGPRKRTGPHRPTGRRLAAPRRVEVLDRLDEERMLPSIYFIFSRKACDEAVGQCLDLGLRLTDGEERARILAICSERTVTLAPADLDVLGHRRWLAGMQAGIASHHAGMVPPFKEAVEACFTAGLVKVVFATETLALGINMPARSVVIERFSKFNGERNETLTPGQYTQLTGRAGRRGIDPVGDAVVLWSPFTTFEEIAERAASRSFAISSSFRPTYNMAANLVRRYQPDEARHLLNLSFAQYQADGEVVRIEARLDRATAKLEAARAELRCDRGDVVALFALERRLEAERADRPDRSRELEEALGQLKPGDVIQAPGGRNGGAAVVTATINRRSGLGIRALTVQRRRLQLSAEDFDRPPERLGRIELPEPYAPNTTRFQRETAQALGRARLTHGTRAPKKGSRRNGDVDEVWQAIADHPAATCPDLGLHRRAAAQVARYERERSALERQVRGRDATLARHFDRVLDLLEQRGHLSGWALTAAGSRLARIYHEADLLVSDCLERGLFDGLDGPTLAGLASGFVYEHRGTSEPPTPWFPSSDARGRWRGIEQLHRELNVDEERRRLPLTRPPDPGFVALAHAWAAGEGLDDLLADDGVSGGDFVRTVKQLLDLLRQLAEVAPRPATREAARVAAEGLFRGVIAASSAGPLVDEADLDEQVEDGGDVVWDDEPAGA